MGGERQQCAPDDQSREVVGQESAKPGEMRRMPRRLSRHPSSPQELADLWGVSLHAAEQVWQPDYDDPAFLKDNWFVVVGGEVVRAADTSAHEEPRSR